MSTLKIMLVLAGGILFVLALELFPYGVRVVEHYRSTKNLVPEVELLRRSQAHYMHMYNMYAATERFRQYGRADASVEIFYGKQNQFVPIDDVTEKVVCPKPVRPLPNGFTFYGFRNIVLNRNGTSPLLYSMSYYGTHAFIKDKDEFDSLIDLGKVGEERIVKLAPSLAANLMRAAPKPLTRSGSFVTPFSFNAADVNKDGVDDFFFGGRLYLSEGNSYRPIADVALDGREVTFAGDGSFLSPKGNVIEQWSLSDQKLSKSVTMQLVAPVATNRPFTILPLNGAVTDQADAIIVTVSTFDFYSFRGGKAERVLSVPADTPHSVIIGARGDFDGDGIDDIWLAESRWKNKDGKIVGRASLLSSRRFKTDASRIEDITSFTLYGSEDYTDYDGIGASLSPIAGDFDGDGKPDLSVPGHIHMNEAGALYILLGRDIAGSAEAKVSDKSIIRIVGKPVSNLAPPFVHYDMPNASKNGRSGIVVTADNDLCSGVAGGAIYILDLTKLVERRR